MICFLARLASTVDVASLSSFTRRANFNCFTPYFHRTSEFTSSTAGNAECRARCLLNCEVSGAGDAAQSESNTCQYFTMYDNRCITGNLANSPTNSAPLTNPFVKDSNAFNGVNPLVPIWFRNPTTGSLDLGTSFPTTARDVCDGFTDNQVIEVNSDTNAIQLAGTPPTALPLVSSVATLAIPAAHTNANANTATADPCNIYIHNKNNLQLTLTLSTFVASVSTRQ